MLSLRVPSHRPPPPGAYTTDCWRQHWSWQMAHACLRGVPSSVHSSPGIPLMFSRGAVKFQIILKIKVILIHFHLKIISARQNQKVSCRGKSGNDASHYGPPPWGEQARSLCSQTPSGGVRSLNSPVGDPHTPAPLLQCEDLSPGLLEGGACPLALLRCVYCRSGRSKDPKTNTLTFSLLPLTFPCAVFMG